MKFALYALGALCFVQLAFAQDVSDSSSSEEELKVRALPIISETAVECIEGKLDAFKTAAQGLTDNLKSQCFTEANQSPETTAAIAILKTRTDALQQAFIAFKQSTSLAQKIINGRNLVTATASARHSLRDVIKSIKRNDAIKQCVEQQVNTVIAPLREITSCFSQ